MKMIQLKSVGFKKYSVYDDLKFDIPAGISIIRGQNASGKSLIGYALPLTLLEHPIATKQKSQGESFVRFDDYDVRRFVEKSTKYTVLHKNEDLQFKTIKEAQAKIRSVFPLTSEYFWSCCYISSARPNFIQFCTPTERLVFFQNLFNLNIYEQIHTKLKQLVLENRNCKVNADLIQAQIDGVLATLVKVDKDKLNELEQRNNKLKAKLSKYEDAQLQNAKYDSIKLLIELDFDLPTAKQKLELLSAKLSKLEKAQRSYERQLHEYEQYKESLKYKDVLNLSLLKSLSKTFNDSKLNELKKEEHYLSIRKDTDFDVEKYRNKTSYFAERVFATKQQIERLQQLRGKDVCPTCGQKIKNANHISDELEQLQAQLKRYERHYDISCKVDNFLAHYDKVWTTSDAFAYVTNFVDKQLDKSIKSRQYINIKQVSKPQEVDAQRISSLRKKVEQLNNHIDLLQQLKTLKHTKLDIDINELRDKQSKVFTKLTSLSIQNESYENARAKIRQYKEEKAQYNYDDLEILEILYEAYGNKGIKSKQIEVLLDTYCKKLNEFATLLYSDKIVFSYRIDANKCEIFAERNGKLGDIATLSGAETRFFQMISALSLICILGIKIDTMWLDEMENGLSPEHLAKFTGHFLPQLKRYIPKIVVITPRSVRDLFIDEAIEYRVVKKHNKSTLERK